MGQNASIVLAQGFDRVCGELLTAGGRIGRDGDFATQVYDLIL